MALIKQYYETFEREKERFPRVRAPIAQKLESTMHRVNYHPVSSREMNWAIYLCCWFAHDIMSPVLVIKIKKSFLSLRN